MKVAILNDTHAGIRNSSEIFIDYQRKFYEEVFFPYMEKHGITEILHLGDYWDNRKSVNFKALNSNREMFLDRLREKQYHMQIIPGNHDSYWNNTNEICALKETMGYYLDEVTIYMDPTIIEYGYEKYRIALVPWVNKSNIEQVRKFLDSLVSKNIDLIAGHFELGGFEMIRGVYSHEDPEMITRLDLEPFPVISGHFHKKSQKGNIKYLGAQLQFTWNDCDEKKYFHVLDTKTGKILPVRSPLTIFERINYDDDDPDINWETVDLSQYENKFIKIFVENKTDMALFNKFIDRMYSIDTHDIKIIENFQGMLEHNHDGSESDQILSTEQIIDEYINNLEINNMQFSVDVLKNRFNKFYNLAVLEQMN